MAVTLSLGITQNSQSVANNTSSVTVTATVSWNWGSYNATGQCTGTITIDGTKYNFSGIMFNKGATDTGSQVIMTKTVNVAHNADGSKTLACAASFDTGVSSGTITASASKTLTKIPRQATITAAPNFTDEGNPVISYSNPAGSAVDSLKACISFTGSKDDIAYRDISKTGTSYTFSLTDAERDVLRNGTTTANSRTVRFYVQTVIGGTTYRSYVAKTLTIVNASPTLTPTVTDSNSATVALTGDANKLVKYYSTASASATYAALKGASISSYSVTHGGKTATTNPATFSAVESGSFVFTVTDSRGNTVTKTVTKALVNYVKLSINVGYEKPTADGAFALTVSGNYFNGSFGAVANTLTVQYRYKAHDGEWGAWGEMAATLSGNTYNAEAQLTGLDYRLAYVFQVKAVDQVCECSSAEFTVKALPVFDWSGEDFNVNGIFKVNNTPFLDLVYPVGSIYMSANSTSPATLFGGTWERVKDTFLLAAGSSYAAGSTGGEATHKLTVSEMPAHSHNPLLGSTRLGGNGGTSTGWRMAADSNWSQVGTYATTQASGGGAAHNNMPPYLAVYVWKRTA